MWKLAWHNLTQNRTQFFLGVGGVALALLLMLALDALLVGSEDDLVAYIERSGADVFVSQEGVKNMHMAASAITYRDMRLAEHAVGVANASPILYTTSVVKTGNADVLSYIIGFDPKEQLGGPQEVVAGTNLIGRDETIIDEAIARSQKLGIGDDVEIFGRDFKIVGMTRGFTNIINSITFIHLKDFQELRRGDAVSYALLKTNPGANPTEVATAITNRNPDVLALPRGDFSREERQIIKDMVVEILDIMNISGLLIGLAVTALTLYNSTYRKRQEYGVLKAIGASNYHLYTVVVVQAVISIVLGFFAAVGLVWTMGQIIPRFIPSLALALSQTSITRVLIAVMVIGMLAAISPALQLSRLDPARVFRG